MLRNLWTLPLGGGELTCVSSAQRVLQKPLISESSSSVVPVNSFESGSLVNTIAKCVFITSAVILPLRSPLYVFITCRVKKLPGLSLL